MGTKRFAGLWCIVAMLLSAPLVCFGGSGTQWKITVRNPTNYHVRAIAYYVKGLGYEPVDNNGAFLEPGQEHTFTVPGSYCPAGVNGVLIVDNTHIYSIRDTSCLGHDAEKSRWTACCWDVTFEVCRKSGSGDDPINNDDFGFCKQ